MLGGNEFRGLESDLSTARDLRELRAENAQLRAALEEIRNVSLDSVEAEIARKALLSSKGPT